MSTHKAHPNITGKPGSGLCEPGLIHQAIQKAEATAPAFAFIPPPPRWNSILPLSPEQRERAYSLVKAPKSRTKESEATAAAKLAFEVDEAFLLGRRHRMEQTGEIFTNPVEPYQHPPERVGHKAPGTMCIIEKRSWADEIRIRTQVETTVGQQPPEQCGPRTSQWLSERGLRTITDSAAYLATVREGYTTFATLTFDDEKRAALAAGTTTIQRELTRCMSAWGKMYSRGLKRQGIPGNSNDFDYLWVVEVPNNSDGEPNPHIHLLMRWRVPHEHFAAWAKRLESAWGQGFAKLEKIKSSKGAGAYISKAVGYLCKGQGMSDQGEVRGNRYGISESARAPGWETLTKTQIDCMGQLISDVYDHLTFQYGVDYRDRKRLNEARMKTKEAIKKAVKASGQRKPPAWLKKKEKAIEQRLTKVRSRLDALPLRANRYQIILKGKEAYEEFMAWASNPTYPQDRALWLPDKPEGIAFNPGAYPKPRDGLFFSRLRKTFQETKRKRWAVTDEVCAYMVEQTLSARDATLDAYDDYDTWANQQAGST